MMKDTDTACPCFKCQKRHPKCHGGCDDYKSWKARTSDKQIEKRKRDGLAEEFLADGRYKGYRKYKRK